MVDARLLLPRRSGEADRDKPPENGAVPARPLLLSTAPAGRRNRRLALGVVVVLTASFLAAAPFAQTPLWPAPAFMPAYEATLVLIDLIAAILLFGQFAQQRSAALLALAAGYLFDGLIIIPHALSFPGLITPTGWLGAGVQTTAWLYMFWHGGFPLFVIGYAVRNGPERYGAPAVIAVIAAVIALCALLTVVAINADRLLPPIMAGNGYTPLMKFVVGAVWALSFAALATLIRKPRQSLLDLWLIVVLCAWVFDIALSAVLNAGRFDLGFYAGRFYGLLAASFVLTVILLETSGLHGRLAALTRQLQDHARDLERRVRERTADLARTNGQLSAILQASPVAIFMLDRNGAVMLWTPSAKRIFGYSAEEALGRRPPYLGDEDLADFRANLERAATDPAATGWLETRRQRKDGAVIEVSAQWARVVAETGELLGIMYAVADITEGRRTENQLRQAQKMEAVGNLTGGLAHDFNNLLAIIVGNLDMLRERKTGDAETDELTDEALEAALRGADLTRRLLAFARRQPLQPQRVDVNRLVGNITQLLKRTLGEEIRVRLQLADGLHPVVVDPAQLEASLANLATNARDAMPRGGDLVIATGNRRLDEDYASQHAEVQAGDYALIEVSDTGTGMPPEVASRIFEPFYTTKQAGKGTGLGLSMVFGFIKQSGGHINVYSEVGIGTTFRLYLPRADAAAQADAAPASPPLDGGRGETVLVVEDNAGLRRVVVRQLTELGYRAREAEDAQTALAMLEGEAVDILLTDVVMPGGISGHELASTVQARWPAIKILLTSGFPESKSGGNAELPRIRLLSKPYRRDELARAIRDSLAQPVSAEP